MERAIPAIRWTAKHWKWAQRYDVREEKKDNIEIRQIRIGVDFKIFSKLTKKLRPKEYINRMEVYLWSTARDNWAKKNRNEWTKAKKKKKKNEEENNNKKTPNVCPHSIKTFVIRLNCSLHSFDIMYSIRIQSDSDTLFSGGNSLLFSNSFRPFWLSLFIVSRMVYFFLLVQMFWTIIEIEMAFIFLALISICTGFRIS